MSLKKLGPDVTIEGDRGQVAVEDDSAAIILNKIWKELKKIRLHLETMTDNHFTDEDI